MDFRILGGIRTGSQPNPPETTVPDGPALVRAYWEGLRRSGAIPARADLDPRGLAQALDRVFIAERIGQGLAQVRIAGSALTDCAGADLRGLPLSCLFLPEARPRLATLLDRVFNAEIAADLHLRAEHGIGRPQLAARLMLLPLCAAAGQPSLVLGCLGMTGEFGRAPRRFSILAAVEERLLITAKPPAAPSIAAAPLIAAASARPQSHLRLVHSA